VALLLFLEPLLQRLHDLVPVAERFDRGHFLGGQEFLGDRLQPVGGDVDGVLAIIGEQALEDLVEHLVEAVEQPLVLHIDRAAQIIELLGATVDRLAVERLQQQQMLLHAHGNARGAEFFEEAEQHGSGVPCRGGGCNCFT
jgi:hypothetical protein